MNGDSTPSFSKSPTHQTSTIEYTSSAPLPPSGHAQNGNEDEDFPAHLYEKLPPHMLENGKPDYLRMILMCSLIHHGQDYDADMYKPKSTPHR